MFSPKLHVDDEQNELYKSLVYLRSVQNDIWYLWNRAIIMDDIQNELYKSSVYLRSVQNDMWYLLKSRYNYGRYTERVI